MTLAHAPENYEFIRPHLPSSRNWSKRSCALVPNQDTTEKRALLGRLAFSWALRQWAGRNPAWAADGRGHKAGLRARERDHWANPYAIAGESHRPRNT